MLPTLLLAAALAASPPTSPAREAETEQQRSPPTGERGGGEKGLILALPTPTLRQEEEWEAREGHDEEERRPHVLLSAWGGAGFLAGGSGASAGFVSAEAAWAFRSVDLGIQGTAYHDLPDARQAVTPVTLVRLTQRFHTRRGFDASFTLGLGAGRYAGWRGWYQVAMGLRLPLGPLFVGGELAFEQLNILRLAGGIGLAF